jgi:hypothetical protein
MREGDAMELYVKSRDHASDVRTGTLARAPYRVSGTLPDGTLVDVTVAGGERLELQVEELPLPQPES